jgi:enamine deaminase RidA (YjgF/YER057c/UK114 family)
MADIAYLKPAGITHPPMYSQVVSARGTRTVYVSGQVPLDADGHLVGAGDYRAQAVQVYENLRLALAGAGATFDDVVKQTTYIVNYQPEHRAMIAEVRLRYVALDRLPASTLVGVQALAMPGMLVEVEVIAVLD